jgi:hypothetical protein
MRPAAEADKHAASFVKAEMDRYRGYHDHKESMAYAGITLFIGAYGAALVSNAWPPQWIASSPITLIAALTGIWLFVLVFAKWQLVRRRWAALRIAGCERLLARWITQVPSEQDLATWRAPAAEERGRRERLVGVAKAAVLTVTDHVWPLRSVHPVVDVHEEVYPTALVREWQEQEGRGTAALFHERLVVVLGWLVYAAVLLRTVA